jgi:pilus retraction protein PilT
MDPRKFLTDCLRELVAKEATDLHVKAGEIPRIRHQRRLVSLEAGKLDTPQISALLDGLLNDKQKQLLRDARSVDFAFTEAGVGRFRVNAFYQKGELALVMRRVKDKVPTFTELGLPPILGRVAEEERGLVLVAGPVGSGKSTTTAAVIDTINHTRPVRIITLEDPIEYLHKDHRAFISQREIGLDTESFVQSLRYVVRQDPDVIFIGEIRDRETLHAALAAAETGRLVMSTVHGKNVLQTFERILGFFPREEHGSILVELSYNLKALISQRLLRRKDGSGLVPACEVMLMNPSAAKMMREGRLERLTQVMQNAGQEGMQTLNQALLELIQKDLISKEEGLAASDHPQSLEMNLKGIFLDEAAGGILGT